MSQRPSVVFFGMRYLGSPPAFRELQATGFDLRAVVMPAPKGTAPLTILPPYPSVDASPTIHLSVASAPLDGDAGKHLDELAREAGIPVLLTPSLRHSGVIDAIAAHQPDVIAVSCFPLRVPPELLRLPRLGCLNLHPSLLPRERGPEPVFWAIRRGDPETGVTIHQMDEGFDTGPILLQERVAIPDGIRLPAFERQLSELGGRLLARAVAGLVAGEIVPTPQDERQASFAPNPTDEDYVVSTDRPARWAYNVVRALAPLDGPLTLHVVATGKRIRLLDALAYDSEATQDSPIEWDGDTIAARFSPGVATFQAAR